MARTALFAALGVVAVAIGGGTAVLRLGRESQPETGHPSLLMSNDIGRLRREALFMYPRGSPVAAAADGLKGLGFRCAPARHLLPNINAPSVQCESAGRGYPKVSRLQVTVIARNGMVSDIAIGNGFDTVRADAETPSPPFVEEAAAEGEGHGGKESKPHGEGGEAAKDGAREHGESHGEQAESSQAEAHGTAAAPKAQDESHAGSGAASAAEGEGHGTASDPKSQESHAAMAGTSHAGEKSAADHDDPKAHGDSAEPPGEVVKPHHGGHPPANPAPEAEAKSHGETAESSMAEGEDHAKTAALTSQGMRHATTAEPSRAEGESAADYDDSKAHGEGTASAREIGTPGGESRRAAAQASEAHGESHERPRAQRESAGDHGGSKARGDGPEPAKDAAALRDQSVRVARQAIKALGRTPRGVGEALDAYAE